MQILIVQMVADISGQVVRLDEARLQMFLNWLKSHGGKVKTANQIALEVGVQAEGNMADRIKNGLKACLSPSYCRDCFGNITCSKMRSPGGGISIPAG